MKKLFIVLLIMFLVPVLAFAVDSLDPPKGNCKPDEVNRCEIKSCTSDLVYRPMVFEDGKAVRNYDSGSHCDFICVCIPKSKELK